MKEKLSARKDLPENYHSAWTFDITRTRELLWLNVLGIGLFCLSLWAFIALARALQPGLLERGFLFRAESLTGALWNLMALLIAVIVMLFVHEGLHGVFFWLFSRSRPKFAFKGYYASASAPGWYFPRRQYILIGLAPLIFITLAGIAGLAWFPKTLVLPTLLILIFNTSGAVGDLWVVGRLLAFPATTYILDSGSASEFFVKNAEETD